MRNASLRPVYLGGGRCSNWLFGEEGVCSLSFSKKLRCHEVFRLCKCETLIRYTACQYCTGEIVPIFPDLPEPSNWQVYVKNARGD